MVRRQFHVSWPVLPLLNMMRWFVPKMIHNLLSWGFVRRLICTIQLKAVPSSPFVPGVPSPKLITGQNQSRSLMLPMGSTWRTMSWSGNKRMIPPNHKLSQILPKTTPILVPMVKVKLFLHKKVMEVMMTMFLMTMGLTNHLYQSPHPSPPPISPFHVVFSPKISSVDTNAPLPLPVRLILLQVLWGRQHSWDMRTKKITLHQIPQFPSLVMFTMTQPN